MTASPRRGVCLRCRRVYRLRADGTIRHHVTQQPGTQWGRLACPGSRQSPLAEDIPTGRFGGPRLRTPDGQPMTDPWAAEHRAVLAAAIRRNDAA